MKRIHWKKLILCLAIPLAVGGLAGLLIRSGVQAYGAAAKPPLSPPAILFPIVWTALYILMGVSSYLIVTAHKSAPHRKRALFVYGLQLLVNFVWPLIFFNLQAYLAAFSWLVLLFVLVLYMVLLFLRINKTAAYLQLPYLLWLAFAGYLNMGVYLLNG